MLGKLKDEVTDLHRFFQSWFRGDLPDSSEEFARLAKALGRDFQMITPGGERLGREQLLESLRPAHGKDPASTIWIEAFEGRPVADGIWQVTYEEWQGQPQSARGRLSSALLRACEQAPRGVEWLHLHEVWLPGAPR